MLFAKGIHGFATKTADYNTLVHAVRQVARGQTYISPCIAGELAATQGRYKETLTERNFAVIRLLGKGYSNDEIAKQLKMGKRTVREHVEKICRVLDLDHAHQLIAWAAAHGFGRPKTD